jgi:hypothetical protein
MTVFAITFGVEELDTLEEVAELAEEMFEAARVDFLGYSIQSAKLLTVVFERPGVPF